MPDSFDFQTDEYRHEGVHFPSVCGFCQAPRVFGAQWPGKLWLSREKNRLDLCSGWRIFRPSGTGDKASACGAGGQRYFYQPDKPKIVIKKGGGNRPCEALATLYFGKEGATFYQVKTWKDGKNGLLPPSRVAISDYSQPTGNQKLNTSLQFLQTGMFFYRERLLLPAL